MQNASTGRILVALDQSRQAENAVHYLASLPLAGLIKPTLFHVRRNLPAALNNIGLTPELYQRLEPERVESWLQQEIEGEQEFMEACRQILLKAGYPKEDVELKTSELKVGFARDIINEAGQGYEAVVVGRSGLSKLKDAVMGSIASKLAARLGKVPVWVVGGEPRGGKMLVALDSSDNSMRAVEHVARIVGSGPQQVLLFHVIRSLEYGGQYAQGFITDDIVQSLNEEGRKAMEPVFEKAIGRLTGAGLPSDSIETMLVTGVPSRAAAIAEQAKQQEYDTIVVGRRGISKVEAFLIGRVGNKVLSFAKKQAVWVVG
jgi:nucleotide-binding universal stress UspA family protein